MLNDKTDWEPTIEEIEEVLPFITKAFGTIPNWGTYRYFTRTTAIYPEACTGSLKEMEYLLYGLANEVGEVLGNMKKFLRGDFSYETAKQNSKKELGDCLYYLIRLCDCLEVNVEDVIVLNMHKLQDRKKRGVLQGSGDSR